MEKKKIRAAKITKENQTEREKGRK
jgi:hypothetical protein